MKKPKFSFVIAFVLGLTFFCFPQTPKVEGDLLIWFDSPAEKFTQSLPLGNGRLGAMVFGDGTKDPKFAALYFQFGRYRLISSSGKCATVYLRQGVTSFISSNRFS